MGLVKWLILPVLLSAVAFYGYYKIVTPPEVVVPRNGWYGSGKERPDNAEIKPFAVDVPEREITELKQRLKNSRVSHEVLEDANTFEYGFNSRYLQKVKDHWLTKFDWRKQEKILNTWPQFTTEIEGVKVHFYHVKPDAKKYKKIFPLLLVHGWPGNVFEFYKILPMLIDPASHGLGAGVAFEVVAPSIPGYGFSGQPKKTGFNSIAAARGFKKLMYRLGHEKFFLQGGDWGSVITSTVGRMYPESAYGVHLNFGSAPFSLKAVLTSLVGTAFPKLLFADARYHTYNYLADVKVLIQESGYMHLQATKPDTVGTALNDSPLGLAAYILEKFSTWTHLENRDLPDGGLTKKFTLDELLTVVTIYWTQGNIVSSQRFYREYFRDPACDAIRQQLLTVPTAHAQFENELFDRDPPEFMRIYYNLTKHDRLPNGGHFAALEEPLVLAKHFYDFARSLIN